MTTKALLALSGLFFSGIANTAQCPVINANFVSTDEDSSNVVQIRTDVAGSNILYSFNSGEGFVIVDKFNHPIYADGDKVGTTNVACAKDSITVKVKLDSGKSAVLAYRVQENGKKIELKVSGDIDELNASRGTYKSQD